MSTQSSASHEREESEDEATDTGVVARAKRTLGGGSGALVAGGTLLAGALRARGRGGRAALQALAGVALVGVGLKQRRAGGEEEITDPSSQPTDDDSDVSAEADAAIQLHDVDQQAEGNPRDVSNEPDVETEETEGDIQFSRDEDLDPRKEPDLDEEEGTSDTRRNDVGDEDADVEVDISESAMADEPNEAAGPSPKQAQPTTQDGETVPEDASEKQVDPDDDEELQVDGDEETDDEDRETVESEGGSTVHTDTMESGTIDIDEDDVTDADDDLNEEPADSDEQSNPRLDDADDEN